MESGDIKGVGPSSASALAGEEKKQELAMKEEEEHQEDEIFGKFVPGPLLPLKEHIEKDKEDESLRRWKEKLLGCLESDLNVDRSSGMLGTFAPRKEPYAHTLEEETTPSGVLARGVYTAKLKFKDDDKRCHMELNYSFEIRKCD
ncbi:rho GDP-dissociation inhibitor 1-like isoform X2 [Primulina tabacum]|uniref:rho GDP-dissociation inhibitor 1-like isoform X2 n=1 Tax=Primulina tabacum TaxID=48773 RepID=UPI003F5ADB48